MQILLLLLFFVTAPINLRAEAWVPAKKQGYKSISIIYGFPITTSETKIIPDSRFYISASEEKYIKVLELERGMGRESALIAKLVHTNSRTKYNLDINTPKVKVNHRLAINRQTIEPFIGWRKQIIKDNFSAASVSLGVMPFEYIVPNLSYENSYMDLSVSYGKSFKLSPKFVNYSYFELSGTNRLYFKGKRNGQRLRATLGHKGNKLLLELSAILEIGNYQYLHRPFLKHQLNLARYSKLRGRNELEKLLFNHLLSKPIRYNNYKTQLKVEKALSKKKYISLATFVDYNSKARKPNYSMMLTLGKSL